MLVDALHTSSSLTQFFHSAGLDFIVTEAGNLIPSSKIIAAVTSTLKEKDSVIDEVLYVSVDSAETMKGIDEVKGDEPFIISCACMVGSTRLIDNVTVNF